MADDVREGAGRADPEADLVGPIYAHSPVPAFVYDPATGAILDANRAAAACFGAPLVGRDLRGLLAPEELPRFERDVLAGDGPTGPARTGRWRLRRLDRPASFWADVVSVPGAWAGRPARVAQCLDVDHTVALEERERQARVELTRADRQRAAMLDALPAALALLDRSAEVVAVNRAWTDFAGPWAGPATCVGANYLDVCDAVVARGDPEAADAAEAARGLRAVLAGELAAFSHEYACRTPERERWFQLWIAPVEGTGRPEGCVVTHLEETERRALQEQLAQAQKLEAVGLLAGGVAHDFNNLLTVVLGRAELLAGRADLARDALAELDVIRRAGERGAALTRQLLQFSRRRPGPAGRVAVNEVAEAVAGLCGRTLGEHVSVALALDPAAGEAPVDRAQLELGLMNLLLNARDAMPRGGVVTVRTAARALGADDATAAGVAPGAWLELAVRDEGEGMSEAVRARAFEPFFTTKPTGQGSGLGLSTVYGVVRAAGGAVRLESAPGRGTTVTLLLPRADPAAPAADPAAAGPPRKASVLLVEDDPDLRELATELLRFLGYEVLVAEGPEHALRLLEGAPRLDLLLTDVVMPAMDGLALAERVRERRPGLPVLYMSGYSRDVLERRGVDPASVRLLHKPFSARAHGDAVRAALEGAP